MRWGIEELVSVFFEKSTCSQFQEKWCSPKRNTRKAKAFHEALGGMFLKVLLIITTRHGGAMIEMSAIQEPCRQSISTESIIIIQGMRERISPRKATIEKRLGVGGEMFPPETKAILPIHGRLKVYLVNVEYPNDEICKMKEEDVLYLKQKLYNTLYRNEYVKKAKTRTKTIRISNMDNAGKA